MRVTETTSPPRVFPASPARLAPRWPDIAAGLRWLPCIVAAVLLAIGYWFRVSGVAHLNDYHVFTFRSLNYSDIIWLYLRDGTAQHLRPYLDYRLEYPPLTGGFIYLVGFAPSLPAYFALTYALLALGGLTTVGVLGALDGANRWYFAAAPGLVLLGGLNWDLLAIGMTALALFAYSRGRNVWGTLALVAAVWLKLFPIVFVGAILVERLRERRWRELLTIGGLFAVGSAAINLPLAFANRTGWYFFYASNNERRPEPSIWTLVPQLTIPQVNAGSLALLIAGGLVLTMFALRSRTPVAMTLGATLLVWWLFVNKIYSPQYGLWVYLALALLAAPRALWVGFALFDAAYYFASFQILYTSLFENAALVEWQTRYLVHPLVVVRLLLLGGIAAYGAFVFWRLSHAAAPQISNGVVATSAPSRRPKARTRRR